MNIYEKTRMRDGLPSFSIGRNHRPEIPVPIQSPTGERGAR
jgi:hypothetical protein